MIAKWIAEGLGWENICAELEKRGIRHDRKTIKALVLGQLKRKIAP